MKKAAFSLMLLAFGLQVHCQDREYQTLIDFSDTRISGFGGPFMQFTVLDGEFAHMMGGGGAVLVGDFFFGGYGLGITNQIPATALPEYREDDYLSVSHGGFWIGYSLFGDRAVHLAVSSLVGWGEVGIRRDFYHDVLRQDVVFVLAPTLEVELNLTRYFRLGAGASYNLFTMISPEQHGYRSSDLSAPGGFLSFKFGWF